MNAVQDALELLSRHEGDDQFGVAWLVVDCNDAFWNAPLAVEERRFFVAKIFLGPKKFVGRGFVRERAPAQGSLLEVPPRI